MNQENKGVYVAEKLARNVVIFDLDNCLANDEWRIKHIQWQHENPDRRYADYHALAGFDAFAHREHVQAAVDADQDIVIFTARPASASAVTREWLLRHNIKVRAIIMRNDGDHRSSVRVKEEQLSWLCDYGGVSLDNIRIAYDDREDILAMYRSRGLATHRLKCHETCAMTPPTERAFK